ncbi:hypothetical protein ABID97_005292 [Variovorax sp. OAS795]
MPKEFVSVVSDRTDPVDDHALASSDMAEVRTVRLIPEEPRHWHM